MPSKRPPALGLGVFQTPPDETRDAVRAALDLGYRHIDTASAYGNEHEVGEAIHASGLDRDDVFIETKVWINDYGYDETLHAFDKSSAKLGVDQIDLLILHQAFPSEFERTIAAYRALETLLRGESTTIRTTTSGTRRLVKVASVTLFQRCIVLKPQNRFDGS